MQQFPDEGYFYMAAVNKKFIEEAVFSAQSLKNLDPDAHITLITDQKLLMEFKEEVEIFDHIITQDLEKIEIAIKDQWKLGLLFKVKYMYDFSPYNKTCFLDTDTYIIENCRNLFSILEFNDICISHAPVAVNAVMVNNKPLIGYTPYNSGVILFRKNKSVEKFFLKWYEIFKNKLDKYQTDQHAFMEALIDNNCKVYVLQNIWNARFIFFEKFSDKVRILHGRHKKLKDIAKQINITTENRIWHPIIESCFYSRMSIINILNAMYRLLKHNLWRKKRGLMKKT
jgi:hypothetical protein